MLPYFKGNLPQTNWNIFEQYYTIWNDPHLFSPLILSLSKHQSNHSVDKVASMGSKLPELIENNVNLCSRNWFWEFFGFLNWCRFHNFVCSGNHFVHNFIVSITLYVPDTSCFIMTRDVSDFSKNIKQYRLRLVWFQNTK